MDEKITIQEPVNTKDDYGQGVPVWTDVATVWARVDDQSGGERLQAEQVTAYMGTKITVRYRSDLDETMRILRLRTGRYYNVRSIKNPDRLRSLEIHGEMLDEPVEDVDELAAFSSGFDEGFDT